MKSQIPENRTSKPMIPHAFLDHAKTPILPDDGEPKYRGGITSHFPILLHAMLTKADTGGYKDICSWAPHGRAFCVHDRDRFVKNVLPLYFQQKHFASFQRQLNLYGFDRISFESPHNPGAYYHPMFLRTRQDLCRAIQRYIPNKDEPQQHTVESTCGESRHAKRAKAIPTFDPNLSSLDPMPPSSQEDTRLADLVMVPRRRRQLSPETMENNSFRDILSDEDAFSDVTTSDGKVSGVMKKKIVPGSIDMTGHYKSVKSPFSGSDYLHHVQNSRSPCQVFKRKLSDSSNFESKSVQGRRNEEEEQHSKDFLQNWTIKNKSGRVTSNDSNSEDLFSNERFQIERTESPQKLKTITTESIQTPAVNDDPLWQINSQPGVPPESLSDSEVYYRQNESSQVHEKLQLLRSCSSSGVTTTTNNNNEVEFDNSSLEPRPIAPGFLPAVHQFSQQQNHDGVAARQRTNVSLLQHQEASFEQQQEQSKLTRPWVSASSQQHQQEQMHQNQLLLLETNDEKNVPAIPFKLLMDQIQSRHQRTMFQLQQQQQQQEQAKKNNNRKDDSKY